MTEVTASVNTPSIFSAMTEVWAVEHANEAKKANERIKKEENNNQDTNTKRGQQQHAGQL